MPGLVGRASSSPAGQVTRAVVVSRRCMSCLPCPHVHPWLASWELCWALCVVVSAAECCRKCTVRRVGVSYKASGPDASGAYNTSYSVVQGVGARRVGDVRRVVQCHTRCRTAPTPYDTVRHSTTQYDTVRHSTTRYDTVRHGTTHTDIYICRHINTCKWKKKQIGQNGAKWVQMRFHFGQNSPKGETSNIGTSRLQHADSVYN